MKIDRLILGAYETNCYILRSGEEAKDCLIVDTGLEADQLIDFLKEHKLNPVAVVLTHGHIDHIAGVAALRAQFADMKVYIHKLDAKMLTEPKHNLSTLTGVQFSAAADLFIEDSDVIEQACVKLQVLHTPGHTPGGICLYSPRPLQKGRGSKDEGIVFTDDTLFADSIGRTDFPNGSMSQLLNSIKEKLFTLPDETKVYPGHGPITTIAHEKAHNQFFQ
ncbi:MAG: MBL fold metallo-hydrolase [Planctomycetota bacterium]|jgi:glyoxylase-like metal-dependent hydrolase (beta-lactamase superfamily II)